MAHTNILLVIVGAGASFGARDSPRPPLGAELLGYVGGYLEGCQADPLRRSTLGPEDIDSALQLVRKAQKNGETFEEMINCRRSEIELPALDKPLRALTFAVVGALYYHPLCWRLDEAFKEKADRYDKLIAVMKSQNLSLANAAFISFNYDLLLEQALRRATPDARGTHRPDDDGPTIVYDWKVYKPHGSVNWWATAPLAAFRDGEAAAVLSSEGLSFSDVFRNVRPYEMTGRRDGAPVIAHFARLKPIDVNRTTLEMVRKGAIRVATSCACALIIGVHISGKDDDDPTLFAVLDRLRGKPVLYVAGPNAREDAETAEAKGFRAAQVGFADALDNNGVIEQFLRQAGHP